MDIRIKLLTMGGEQRDIETPHDLKVKDFIVEVVVALRLPLTDAENHPISWRVDDKDSGKTLDGDKTLEENGVSNGHRLALIRSTVAGLAETNAGHRASE